MKSALHIIDELQHRFYGKSMPFGGNKDIAYTNASTLGYLSSTQALADYATLITDLKRNLTATESPVIVFGGSYGGSMPIQSSILLICFGFPPVLPTKIKTFCSFVPIFFNFWFWDL